MTGTINENHPETREGEIWLTNTSLDGYHDIGYETKRIGKVAYTINDDIIIKREILSIDYNLYPIFIKSYELDKRSD